MKSSIRAALVALWMGAILAIPFGTAPLGVGPRAALDRTIALADITRRLMNCTRS